MPKQTTSILPRPGHGPSDQLSGASEMPLVLLIGRLQALLNSIPEDDRGSAVVYNIGALTAKASFTISGEQAANDRLAIVEQFLQRLANGETIEKEEAAAVLKQSRTMYG